MALTEHHPSVPRDPDRDPVLDRVYAEGARDEPPARLDDAIRAAARREVRAGPRSLRAMLRSWRMPVSIAAILVLSASLVVLMKEEGANDFYRGPAPEAARTEQYYERPPAAAPAPKGAPESLASAPPTPAAPTAKPDLRMEQAASKARDDMPRQVESVLARVQPSAIPPAAPAEERQAAAREADRISSEAGRMAERAAPFAAAAPAKPVAPGDAVAKRADPDLGIRGQSAGNLAQEAKPSQQEDALRRRAASPAPASPAPVWAGFERQPPEKWVERIEELRRAGREAEAREMLGEFRKRFPEYPLPAALTR